MSDGSPATRRSRAVRSSALLNPNGSIAYMDCQAIQLAGQDSNRGAALAFTTDRGLRGFSHSARPAARALP
jgi:hypothetical protein